MMKIPVEQMFYVKMIDFGFVWSLYFISLDLQQMEEIKNIYVVHRYMYSARPITWTMRDNLYLFMYNTRLDIRQVWMQATFITDWDTFRRAIQSAFGCYHGCDARDFRRMALLDGG